MLAQLVEQRTFNPLVASSNLARPTKYAKGRISHPALSRFVSYT